MLRYVASSIAARLDLTKKEMGERLQMNESAYSDIETGMSVCQALTETLLLIMQEDPSIFLNRLVKRFEEALQPV